MARFAEEAGRWTVWFQEALRSGRFGFEAWEDRRPACDERRRLWEKAVGGDGQGWCLSWYDTIL
jgi:hypothetical protein